MFCLSQNKMMVSLTEVFLFPQPGKLAEAFKYFVQGMGYSEYQLFIITVLKGAQERKNMS